MNKARVRMNNMEKENKKAKQKCIMDRHKKMGSECFNSLENKGKSAFICKNCGIFLGVIFPLDNEDKYDNCIGDEK